MSQSQSPVDVLRANLAAERLASASILVAVSGGPDSVALLLACAEVRAEFDLRLIAAHVNHGWRGAAAAADAAWVAELAAHWEIPAEILTVGPERQAELAGKSLEEGARDVRYALLIETARKHGCGFVAVGHTADDQVETVLHHVIRGTGLAGLAGMPRRRSLAPGIELLRPLLSISRADLLTWLEQRQQLFRIDATNTETVLTRNRLRLEVLPMLREKFNSQVDAAILRLAEQAAEAAGVIDAMAGRLLDQTLLAATETEFRLDAARLAQEPVPLIRAVVRELWIRQKLPRQEMGRREWERLAQLVLQPGAIDLPGGIHAERTRGPLILRRTTR